MVLQRLRAKVDATIDAEQGEKTTPKLIQKYVNINLSLMLTLSIRSKSDVAKIMFLLFVQLLLKVEDSKHLSSIHPKSMLEESLVKRCRNYLQWSQHGPNISVALSEAFRRVFGSPISWFNGL